MLTELKTMTVREHYAICSRNRYALAGNNCCRWHQKMPEEYRTKPPQPSAPIESNSGTLIQTYQAGYQAGYRAGKRVRAKDVKLDMRLYRIEKNGLGPYGSPWSNKLAEVGRTILPYLIRHGHYACTIFPTRRDDYFFGCKSLSALERYFSKRGIKGFRSIGFQVVYYNVPKKYVLFGEGELSVNSAHLPKKKHIICVAI